MNKLIPIVIILLFALSNSNAETYHVRTTGSDTNNGTSWATAFRNASASDNSFDIGR